MLGGACWHSSLLKNMADYECACSIGNGAKHFFTFPTGASFFPSMSISHGGPAVTPSLVFLPSPPPSFQNAFGLPPLCLNCLGSRHWATKVHTQLYLIRPWGMDVCISQECLLTHSPSVPTTDGFCCAKRPVPSRRRKM